MGDTALFRSRRRPRVTYERRPWLDGPKRRTLGRQRHRLDLRIPTAILAAVALFVGLKGQGLLAGRAPEHCEVARIASCYDGDTCEANIGGRLERVRLVGFDTPELEPGARCPSEHHQGLVARDRLRGMIGAAHNQQFCAHEEDYFTRDDYGRVLAILMLDGHDVAPIMIEAGLAVPYPVGVTPNWCF